MGSVPAAAWCLWDLTTFPSGQWMSPVPRLSVCLPLGSALVSALSLTCPACSHAVSDPYSNFHGGRQPKSQN